MYESDVEYFDDLADETETVKQAIWEDGTFKDYIREVGLEEALYEVTSFCKSIADNLRTNQITDLTVAPKWAGGAVRLLTRARARRQQLRRLVRDVMGEDVLEEIRVRVEQEVEEW